MNLAQMGMKYSVNRSGKTVLVPMTAKEQEQRMQNRKRMNAIIKRSLRQANNER